MLFGYRQRSPLLQATLVTVVIATVAVLVTGCFLFPKKKSSQKSPTLTGLIITQEGNASAIFLDRIGDGESARLQFKTTKMSFCELSFYSQDEGAEPTKSSPHVQNCAAGPARTQFTEKLEGLRTDVLYEVEITAWAEGSDRNNAEKLIVRETAQNTENPTSDGKLNELVVARFNIPLKVAEVYRHSLSEPTEPTAIKTRLNRQLGCQQGVPANQAAFREASDEIGIRNLATRDFATATAAPNPENPSYLQLNYSTLNDGMEKWTLLYQLGEQDVSVVGRPMSRILNLEMESSDIMPFEEPQLVEAADPLVIDATKPLKFSWTTTTLIDQSYMSIQIGRADDENAIYCVFPAAQRSGTVETALLDRLDSGRYVVSAELNTNQFWAKDGWVISVFDWRSSRIEK